MVLPAKIFEVKEKVDIGIILAKLKDFHEEESYETAIGETIILTSEILDLTETEGTISGIFSKDYIQRRTYKRQLVETPITEESHFWIQPFQNRVFIIVSAPSVARGVKKLLTNFIANKLSQILFILKGSIVEVTIMHDTLKELHESNPQATKLIWFDQVDLPGVEKLCLAGSDLADTTLYQDYLKHGKIWYVVFEVHRQGIVIGVTRNCVITLFSKSTTQEFIDYILKDVIPLIE
jgi:hypothetical protein